MHFTRYLFVLALLSIASSAYGTRQERDPLLWKGETVHPVCGATIWDAFPKDQRPKFDVERTSNWKGYYAEWEIKDDVLFLNSLSGKIEGVDVGIRDVFPGKEAPINCAWYTGTIIIPRGKEIGLMKGEARYVYTAETHISIEKGKVVKVEEKTFDPETTPVWKRK